MRRHMLSKGLAGGAAASVNSGPLIAASSGRKRSVLLLISGDQGLDLGCYGSPDQDTAARPAGARRNLFHTGLCRSVVVQPKPCGHQHWSLPASERNVWPPARTQSTVVAGRDRDLAFAAVACGLCHRAGWQEAYRPRLRLPLLSRTGAGTLRHPRHARNGDRRRQLHQID